MTDLTLRLCPIGTSPVRIELMEIGRAIYAVRKEKGLKLEAVANDAGTDAGYLSRIETGSRVPSIPMLERIAAAMGVRTSSIVAIAEGADVPAVADGREATPDLSEQSIQLRQQFRTLSDENQQALLEIAKVLGRLQRG